MYEYNITSVCIFSHFSHCFQKLRDELQSIEHKFTELSAAVTASFAIFNDILDVYQEALKINERFIL